MASGLAGQILVRVEVSYADVTAIVSPNPVQRYDSAAMVDAIAIGQEKGISDPIVTSDSVTFVRIVHVTDTLGMIDSVIAAKGTLLTSSSTMTDSLTISRKSVQADSITTSDAVSTFQIKRNREIDGPLMNTTRING